MLPAGFGKTHPPYPAVWFFPCLGEDAHTVHFKSGLAELADRHGLAVVVATTGNDFLVDLPADARWSFFEEEFFDSVRDILSLSPCRKHNFVMGLSIGGYAATRLALAHPERFAAACSLSGAVAPDVLPQDQRLKDRRLHSLRFVLDSQLIPRAFGSREEYALSEGNLASLAAQCAGRAGPAPRLMLAWGREDALAAGPNRAFADTLAAMGIRCETLETPGGHDWACWNEMIPQAIEWMLKD